LTGKGCKSLSCGYTTRKEVLSMRLGKEQAAGYVEDTGFVDDTHDLVADAVVPEESTAGRQQPLTAAAEPGLPVRV
jgi:hypothetical protein